MSYAAEHELHVMHRVERRAWAQERQLEREMAAYERRHRAVVEQLRAAGFPCAQTSQPGT